MPFTSDAAALDALLFPLKVGFGILLGYMLLDFFHNKFPPEDPDAWV